MNDPSISLLATLQGDRITEQNGWKFQISIGDSPTTQQRPHKTNLAKGYNRVKEVLLHYRIGSFKVVNDITADDSTRKPEERGKQITIYTRFSPHIADWKPILRDITIALLLPPHTQPSTTSSNCKILDTTERNPITFISYRTDFNQENPKTPIDDKTSLRLAKERQTFAYNPFSYHDPFGDIRFIIAEDAQQLLSEPFLLQSISQIDSQLEPPQQRAATPTVSHGLLPAPTYSGGFSQGFLTSTGTSPAINLEKMGGGGYESQATAAAESSEQGAAASSSSSTIIDISQPEETGHKTKNPSCCSTFCGIM